MEKKKLIHLAIIVDGNGRWAKQRGKPRSLGHKAGMNRLEKIILHAKEKGIKQLSLYVFSTENFKRSKEEIDYLMNLFIHSFKRFLKKYMKENIKIIFSGRRHPLEEKVWNAMNEITETTKNNKAITVNFCLNYGGHAEIVDTTKKICMEVLDKKIDINDIDEKLFEQNLYQNLDPVDLLIRTSGECRISNFLPWQLAYAEFYFTPTYFPDFTNEEFDKAIDYYYMRDRRFGGITYEDKNH